MFKEFVNSIKRKDIIISFLILGVTFGYYLDEYFFPQYSSEPIESYELEYLVYFSKMKLLIISFGLIWYFTCKHWWKTSILIVVFIEILKLTSILNSEQSSFDEIEHYVSLPITIPLVLLLFYITHKINKYNSVKYFTTQLDAEIDEIFFELHQDNDELKRLEDQYKKLKNTRYSKDYLKKLIEVRDEFYKI